MDWEWFDDLPTRNVFLILLMGAEYENRKWHGLEIQAGQMLTTLTELSKLSGFTEKQVRTALKHLEQTGEITRSVPMRSVGTIITIVNWDSYQDTGNDTRAEESSAEKPLTEPNGDFFSQKCGGRQAEERAEEGHDSNPLSKPVGADERHETGSKKGEYIEEIKEEKKDIIYTSGELNLFQEFWQKYPRKAKSEFSRCRAIFDGYPVPVQRGILVALDEFLVSQNWEKDNGQWIPSAVKWLSEERWKWVGTWRTAPYRQETKSCGPQPTYDLDEIQRLMIISSMS